MAIDTRDKRSSAICVGLPWRNQSPNPDGATFSQADRQHYSWNYSGILAEAPVVETVESAPIITRMQTKVGSDGGFLVEPRTLNFRAPHRVRSTISYRITLKSRVRIGKPAPVAVPVAAPVQEPEPDFSLLWLIDEDLEILQ